MKHICHLTSVHPRYDTRIFFKECLSLQKAGFDVSFIVADGLGSEKKHNVNIYDVGKPASRIKRIFLTTIKIYKKSLKLNADIYHFHDPELIPVAIRLKKKQQVVFYDVHEDVPRQTKSKPYLQKNIASGISFIIERYENYAAGKFDAVVAATPFIKNRFQKINTNTANINNYPIIDELNSKAEWGNKKNRNIDSLSLPEQNNPVLSK